LNQTTGTALNPFFDTNPGKFYLKFDNMPQIGYYWITALGTVDNTTNQYPWAIVTVPFGTSLFILFRDIPIPLNYETEALAKAKEQGFTNYLNKPKKTFQSKTECLYAPVPVSDV
jgi:lipocalin